MKTKDNRTAKWMRDEARKMYEEAEALRDEANKLENEADKLIKVVKHMEEEDGLDINAAAADSARHLLDNCRYLTGKELEELWRAADGHGSASAVRDIAQLHGHAVNDDVLFAVECELEGL